MGLVEGLKDNIGLQILLYGFSETLYCTNDANAWQLQFGFQ
jgi:hypothetical protein